MADAEKVTKQDMDWIEANICRADHSAQSAVHSTFGPDGVARLRGILAKCPTIEESPNEATCREVRERVRAAYAGQQEPTKAEQVAFAAAEFVRKASTFLTDNVPTYGGKPGTLRADSDGRWQIKDSSGRVVAEGFPRKAPEQATPAPETNPPIALAGARTVNVQHFSGGGTFGVCGLGNVPVGKHGEVVLTRADLDHLLRGELTKAANERERLGNELARTKAALESVKRDDSGLRAALEKCEATLAGASVYSIAAAGGIQWADIVLPGGLLVRVKGGAK